MRQLQDTGVKTGLTAFLILLLALGISASAAAGENLSVKSRGRIVHDNATTEGSDDVVFDATDFTIIQLNIDTLEKKIETLKHVSK